MTNEKQEGRSGLRLALMGLGALMVVGGLVLVFVPVLVSDPGPAKDLFATIERRVRWGGLIGVGAFLVARSGLGPWRTTLLSFVFWIAGGYLLARFVGLALDGVGSGRQWMWVGVEVAIMVVAGFFLWRKPKESTTRA